MKTIHVSYCKSYWPLYEAECRAREALDRATPAERRRKLTEFLAAQQAVQDHQRDCHACEMTNEVRVMA